MRGFLSAHLRVMISVIFDLLLFLQSLFPSESLLFERRPKARRENTIMVSLVKISDYIHKSFHLFLHIPRAPCERHISAGPRNLRLRFTEIDETRVRARVPRRYRVNIASGENDGWTVQRSETGGDLRLNAMPGLDPFFPSPRGLHNLRFITADRGLCAKHE